MANFDYSPIAKITKELIDKFGRDIILTKSVAGTYDPSTGRATVTKTSQTTRAAIFDYGTKNVDGTLIKVGDKQMLVSPLGIVAVEDNYTVTVSGVTYTITMVKELNPGGTSILYECNVRP